MGLELVLVIVLLGGVCAEEPPGRVMEPGRVDPSDDGLMETDLILAFVLFRHGDRTPDPEELAMYPFEKNLPDNVFFPYGKKALTNKGKQRGYLVGKYLRQRYDGLISRLYLPDEIAIRTTYYARTQMTALAALSALYRPPPAQKWNPNLDWQPIPYNTPPFDADDILYWYHCPRYFLLRDKIYENPEVKQLLEPYQPLLHMLTEKTGVNITKPEDVLYLDNLFQTLANVGVEAPKWAQDVMPQIKAVSKIEYVAETHIPELIKLATGVIMQTIIKVTSSAIYNTTAPVSPKLYLYSAHENNVAAMMAAARVFEPHQPNYGATFSLELRKNLLTDEYGMVAVYSRNAGGPAEILPINGCGGKLFCEYNTFVSLLQDIVWSQEEMDIQCSNVTQT